MARKKWHFFIIESDDHIVKLYKKCLEKHGHTVSRHHAHDDALSLIKKLQPDCILANLATPDLDGWSYCNN